MKKQLFVSAIILALVPACAKKKKSASMRAEKDSELISSENRVQQNIKDTFLEDADEFILVEEENPFTRTAEKDKPLLSDEEADRAAYDRSEQSQYGLKTIYFDFDKFKIENSEKPMLDENAHAIKQLTDKGYVVVIEGHACRSAGSAVYNMMLSEKRAKNVKNYLVKKGIRKDKLKIVGRGFEMCLIQEGDRLQQKPNRRVEFRVLSK